MNTVTNVRKESILRLTNDNATWTSYKFICLFQSALVQGWFDSFLFGFRRDFDKFRYLLEFVIDVYDQGVPMFLVMEDSFCEGPSRLRDISRFIFLLFFQRFFGEALFQLCR